LTEMLKMTHCTFKAIRLDVTVILNLLHLYKTERSMSSEIM